MDLLEGRSEKNYTYLANNWHCFMVETDNKLYHHRYRQNCSNDVFGQRDPGLTGQTTPWMATVGV